MRISDWSSDVCSSDLLEPSDIYARHNDYARLKMLTGMAYAKKGRVSVTGANAEDPDVEVVFGELDNWLKTKKRFLGEASLAEVQYRYIWAKEIGRASCRERVCQ